MDKEDADAIEALATGAFSLFQQSPRVAFASIAALAGSIIVAALITRRLKQKWPIRSRIRILIDYLSTVVLTIIFILALMQIFKGTLANTLVFVMGGALGSFLVVRVVGAVVELLFKPHEPFRSILRVGSVLFWFALFVYLFGQWNPAIKGFFEAEIPIGDSRISAQAIFNILFLGAIILIVTIWISETVQRYLHRRSGLQPNLALALDRIISVTMWVVAALLIISLAGINLTALAAFGGALGIGLGLGFQKLAASYISGLILLFERSVRVGDNLVTDRISGKVTEMTIRYTTIHTTDGLDVLISNDTLISSTIFNETLSDSNIRLECPVAVASSADLDAARRIFLDAAQKQPRVLKQPPPRIFTATIENKSIKLLARFWISDPSNGRIEIISDINEMILQEFKNKGIDLA